MAIQMPHSLTPAVITERCTSSGSGADLITTLDFSRQSSADNDDFMRDLLEITSDRGLHGFR